MKALVIVTLALSVAGASAAPITVNSTADDTLGGDTRCTLREAIANVNASADTTSGDCVAGTGADDTIAFNLAPPARIRLVLGELAVQRDVTIIGPGEFRLRIDGTGRTRIFEIAAGSTTISNLTIIHARTADNGGGVFVDNGATLALTGCTLEANHAYYGGGIGIDSTGTATLANCTLRGNKAHSGGAIANDGALTLTDCTVRGNAARDPSDRALGGGISNNGMLTMSNCTLTRNVAIGESDLTAGGAVANDGTAFLTNCTLSGNIVAGGFSGGFSGENLGGGFADFSSSMLTNCTLSRNTAHGPFLGDETRGGGITGSPTLINTIVVASGPAGNCDWFDGPPISNGHNLDDDGTCFVRGGSDLVNMRAELTALENHGGATKTMALCTALEMPTGSCLARSPAIDAGDDSVTGPSYYLTTDQRGLPRSAGAHVDIGAYEAQ